MSGERFTGPIGLLIVVLIGIATVLLIVNMNKRIKRLPSAFPEDRDERAPDAGSGPDRD
jgi:hypothetical protein